MDSALRSSTMLSRRNVLHIRAGDGIVHLGEAERIKAAERAVRNGYGDVLEAVERAQRRAEARAAELLIERSSTPSRARRCASSRMARTTVSGASLSPPA